MKRVVWFFILVSGVTSLFESCSSLSPSLNTLKNLERVDKSYLNHPAMDLKKNLTPSSSSSFTSLQGQNLSAGAGCTTCAK